MKYISIVLLVLSLGCSKKNSYEKNIKGTWKLEQTSGGFGGIVLRPKLKKNEAIKFKSKKYVLYKNDTIFKKGNYEIYEDSSKIVEEKIIKINLENYREFRLELQKETLYITPDHIDARTRMYKKSSSK